MATMLCRHYSYEMEASYNIYVCTYECTVIALKSARVQKGDTCQGFRGFPLPLALVLFSLPTSSSSPLCTQAFFERRNNHCIGITSSGQATFFLGGRIEHLQANRDMTRNYYSCFWSGLYYI